MSVSSIHSLTHKGVSSWCFDKLAVKHGGKKTEIEVDGLAFSSSSILMIESKTLILPELIEEFYGKICTFRWVNFVNLTHNCLVERVRWVAGGVQTLLNGCVVLWVYNLPRMCPSSLTGSSWG